MVSSLLVAKNAAMGAIAVSLLIQTAPTVAVPPRTLMPTRTPQQWDRDDMHSGFDVVWNSPWPSACPASTIHPTPDFARFGVRTNANAEFNGNVVHTIYCPTSFSTFPHFDENGTAVNGGIPQRGNLTWHLDTVTRDVESLFPDVNFDGYAVIDW